MKRILVTACVGLVLATFAPRVFAQVKIAVVDLQRALNETEDGRRAKQNLKTLFNKRQKGLDAKQEELKKMKESIEKQKDVLSREALAKKLEDYQKQFVELQTVYMEYQRELAQKESQLTEEILAKMQDILRRVGQRDGYTLIVESNEGGVVWAPTNLDLTDVVIQQYNAGAAAATKGGGGAGAGGAKAAKKAGQ